MGKRYFGWAFGGEMRRPIFCFLLAFACGILLEFYMVPGFPHYVLLGCLGLVFFRKKGLLWLLISAVLLGCLSFSFADRHESDLAAFDRRHGELQGEILSAEEGVDSLTLVVQGEYLRVGAREIYLDEKTLVRCYGTVLSEGRMPGWAQDLVGRRASFSGKVSLPAGRRNPNLFDYSLYLESQGIRSVFTTETFAAEEIVSAPLRHGAALVRGRFIREIHRALGREEAGLMVGMLFGDRSFLSEDIYTCFQQNGTAHILAVSGLHVGTVYLFIRRLTGGSKRLLFRVLTLVLLWIYAALADFSPSVVRAAVMITIHILGEILLRRYDLLCGTSAAALLMLLVNPFYLFDAGFQLSFIAVFSLAFLLPFIEKIVPLPGGISSSLCGISPVPRGILSFLCRVWHSLTPLLAIQLGMIPVMAFHFLSVSPGAFFLNPPTLFLAGFLIPLGIVLIPLSFPGGPVFTFLTGAAGGLSRCLILLNEGLYVPGLSSVAVPGISRVFLVLYYGILFFLVSETRRLKGVQLLPLLLAGLFAFGFFFSFVSGEWKGRAELSFLDVGQGDCLLIQSPSGKNVLIDGGGSRTYDVGSEILMPYMRKNGVRQIDLALISHLHDDHFLGVSSLAEQFPVRRMEWELKAGDLVQVDEDVWIEILYPEEAVFREGEMRQDDENETCLLMKVHYDEVTVLMTGDMGFEQEDAVLDLYADRPEVLRSDILKVGHHGSRYSTSDEFLAAVDPEVAVIQVGKNNFGHPHEDVIEKLRQKGIMVYRNDLDGAILIDVKNGEFQVKTML